MSLVLAGKKLLSIECFIVRLECHGCHAILNIDCLKSNMLNKIKLLIAQILGKLLFQKNLIYIRKIYLKPRYGCRFYTGGKLKTIIISQKFLRNFSDVPNISDNTAHR